ncbi:MAG: hypothetical protein R6V31_03145 [Halohasta sp.]
MTVDTDAERRPDSNRRLDAVETPSRPTRPSGTEPDEWRFGAYPRIVEETDGCPR